MQHYDVSVFGSSLRSVQLLQTIVHLYNGNMPTKCKGRSADEPCIFGRNGKQCYVHGSRPRCLWCDKNRNKAEMLDKSKWGAIDRQYRAMDEAIQQKAMEYVEDKYLPHFHEMKRTKRCQGLEGEKCIFGHCLDKRYDYKTEKF